VLQERRKKEREVEEKRLAAERAAEDERRKAVEVINVNFIIFNSMLVKKLLKCALAFIHFDMITLSATIEIYKDKQTNNQLWAKFLQGALRELLIFIFLILLPAIALLESGF